MRLEEFPRPDGDNGLGIHFGRDLRQISLDTYIQKMRDLRLKWCLVPHQDELQLQSAAQAISAAGILPLSRWICKIDQSLLDFESFVRVLQALKIPAYIQIFNEPGDRREWKTGQPDLARFVQRWIQHAATVAAAGGFPGLQMEDLEELRVLLRAVRLSQTADVVLGRMWFCPHSYGANHPPDYPYDTRNRQDHPGATVSQDDSTVLGFLNYAAVFQQEIGFVPPFIVGEGGWQYGNYVDARYPKVDDNLYAQYQSALFDSFRTGKLPHGEPLPDYVFAFCPKILYGPEPDAWYSWSTGTRKQTINACKSIPTYVRHFEWENETPKPIAHYLLFGSSAALSTRSMLVGARKYISQFAPTLGFDPKVAANAQNVTILGDARSVDQTLDAQLQSAGCRVERLGGDQYAVDAILAERAAGNSEYG